MQKSVLKVHNLFVILRLSLSGALIGIAIAGLVSSFPYSDLIAGVIGGVSVAFAKYKHFF